MFYSFFIMYVCLVSCEDCLFRLTIRDRLLFMTYNGFIMLAVGVGAFLGYLLFGGGSSSSKSAACH